MTKIVVITGATQGIGRALAIDLAQDHQIVLVARKKEMLQQLADEISNKYHLKENHKPLVIEADVTEEKAIKTAFDSIIKSKGRIDILINNAGVFEPGTLQVPHETTKHVFDVNFHGLVNCTNAVAPIMIQQQSGYILNIGSRAGKYARPSGGIYAASKHAVVGFNDALHQELIEHGIKVSAICPGAVDTGMNSASGIPSEKRIPLIDICKTVRYFSSLSPNTSVKDVVLNCTWDEIRSRLPPAIMNDTAPRSRL